MIDEIKLETDVKVKKAFIPMVAYLEENKNKSIKTILADFIDDFCKAKGRTGAAASTFIRIDGEVIAMKDAYYKRWLPLVGPDAVEFGIKAGSSTGFNPMSPSGLAAFQKQQRVAKKALMEIFNKVKKGEIKYTEIEAEEKKIEAARVKVEDTELGFDSLEACIEYLEDLEYEIPEAVVEKLTD
jgi:hypothetical protein